MAEGIQKAEAPKLTSAERRFCEALIADPLHDAVKALAGSGLDAKCSDPRIRANDILARPQVVEFIRSKAVAIQGIELAQALHGRAICMDLWTQVIRCGGEMDGQEVSIRDRLQASALMAKACGMGFAEHSRERPSVNVNVRTDSGIQVADPYAPPSGGGMTVQVEPVPGGFGGGGADAD